MVVEFGRGTVCTVAMLTTSPELERQALEWLARAGFDEDRVHFVLYRNHGENTHEPYSAITDALSRAQGGFLVVQHQDVEPLDSLDQLVAVLADLSRDHPTWAIAGNAGFIALGRAARRISDPYTSDIRLGRLPAKVTSLDENLLILSLANPVAPSTDLSGFHMYGTDLCFNAASQGLGSFVIDWHVRHHSKGSPGADWKIAVDRFEAHHGPAMGTALIQIPTTVLLFGLFKVLRPIRKTVWRAVRHGNRALHRLGLRKRA